MKYSVIHSVSSIRRSTYHVLCQIQSTQYQPNNGQTGMGVLNENEHMNNICSFYPMYCIIATTDTAQRPNKKRHQVTKTLSGCGNDDRSKGRNKIILCSNKVRVGRRSGWRVNRTSRETTVSFLFQTNSHCFGFFFLTLIMIVP